MVRFTVLASGSKGNCTVVSGGRTRILIDAGLSCRELVRRMKLVGEDPATLDAIVITHEHQDHINGLAVTARKLGIPVYFTEATHRAWMRLLTPRRTMTYAEWLEQRQKQAAENQAAETQAAENQAEAPGAWSSPLGQQMGPDGTAPGSEYDSPLAATLRTLVAASDPDSASEDSSTDGAFAQDQPPSLKDAPAWLPAVEYFEAGQTFSIGDISLNPFTIPHDAADPVGFTLSSESVRIGFATDLGYMPPNVKAQLQRLDLLLLESNHDLEMLRDGPYPWSVKQRVMSRVGHLSNDAAAEFLSTEYDGQAAYVILAHLSESNNLPDLARVSADRALSCRPSLLANRLMLAEQQAPLDPITF